VWTFYWNGSFLALNPLKTAYLLGFHRPKKAI
jgi:hypothetical protein